MWEGKEGDGKGSTREEEEDRKVQENVVGNRIIAIFCQHVFKILDSINHNRGLCKNYYNHSKNPKMIASTGHTSNINAD